MYDALTPGASLSIDTIANRAPKTKDKKIARGSIKATIIVLDDSDDYEDPIESTMLWLTWTENNDCLSENSVNREDPASDRESASRISGTR
ncbi:hypothetical protein PHJA_000725600 [Phtheirospermum japonicum]|uniref:Uncharacterized protein n=1 Tax=Phtheirospermum japonicum TaxID=374723 RepID=A0A830BK62_9LAMI|nr:hypothetical protein PHJA_000725600 [Phtheirospermum japonicum]